MEQTEIEKRLENYTLIPMSEIDDEAKLLAVRWVEAYGTMGFDIQNKHKLASDIMNYARNQKQTKVIGSIDEEKKDGIKNLVDTLADYERVDLFSNYCKHCGSPNTKCQCWNDD